MAAPVVSEALKSEADESSGKLKVTTLTLVRRLGLAKATDHRAAPQKSSKEPSIGTRSEIFAVTGRYAAAHRRSVRRYIGYAGSSKVDACAQRSQVSRQPSRQIKGKTLDETSDTEAAMTLDAAIRS